MEILRGGLRLGRSVLAPGVLKGNNLNVYGNKHDSLSEALHLVEKGVTWHEGVSIGHFVVMGKKEVREKN